MPGGLRGNVLFHYDEDILIHAIGLYLDARRKRHWSFVSHAHSDHMTRHESVLATPATIALGNERLAHKAGMQKRPRARTPQAETPVEFRKPLRLDGLSVTLYPAGHILGSAQILVEHDGRRLLYSGDFCPEKTSAAEEIEIPRADTLIMECTYGLPEHSFPPRQAVVENLVAFVEKTLAEGRTPVCLAYALGKGQEVLRILSEKGFAVAAETETYRLAKVYERFGVTFGRYRHLSSPVKTGEVVVTPGVSHIGPHLDGRKTRTAAVTGWAVGGFSWRAARADRRIPLSDHADFNGLLAYVKAVTPEIVYITHGPDEFGYYLKKAGFGVGSIRDKAPSLFGQQSF